MSAEVEAIIDDLTLLSEAGIISEDLKERILEQLAK